MTHPNRTITCATIGEGNLLLCCLKDLRHRSFHVNAVFTTTECVETFCRENKIPCYKRNEDIVKILSSYETEFLFSISNPRILKEDVLRIPKKLTINYHDSPLPAYAGVHATSWAIMRGERHHGISWHVAEAGIDTGNILQSEAVEIIEDDSAFTLNLKCVEAAKRAFGRLLNNIVDGEINHKKQPNSGRSYFGLHEIPPDIGVLNFNDNIDNVYNMARALEFGHHDNALGTPKVKTSTEKFLLVTNATKPNKEKYPKGKAPGTILEIIDDTLVVATKSSPIHISVAHLNGSAISKGLFPAHDLVVGDRLGNIMHVDVNDLKPVKKKETYWRRKLGKYEPTMFYRQKMNVVASIIDVSSGVNVKSEKIELPTLQDTVGDVSERGLFLQACFVAFLARINCTPTVHIGFLTDKKDIPNECIDLYSDISPGIFDVDIGSTVSNVFEKCLKEIKSLKEASTFFHDIFYRYPELHGHQPTPQHNMVVVGPKQLSDQYIQRIMLNCNILIRFGREKESEMEILSHERPAKDFGHILDVLQHFATFLKATSDIKEALDLKSLSMVSTDEMNQFYKVQSQEENDRIQTEYISRLIDHQCNLTPLSIALKTTSCMMTYSKLANEVDIMQTFLTKSIHQSDGEQGKPVVAIHAPNSISYVISVLALAKCHMAFLPIPYDLPADRIVFTLNDSEVKRMIMTRSIFDNYDMKGLIPFMKLVAEHEIADEKVVLVEFDRVFPNENEESLVPDNKESDFLYLMYTSGSTGRPKGVKVKESGVINLARAQIMCWDIVPGDVVAQFASIGFDASVSEILTALLSGASLAVLDVSERLGNDFLVAMNKLKVSVITLPPSALNIYSPEELPDIRKVVAAGEACTLNLTIKWTSAKTVRFFNAYGPTEATVCATVYEHFPKTLYEDVNRDLPVGKAIDGVHVYLFDDFMHPIPPDVVGEIYIGGKGLAHGYIGHAQHFTKERFIQNPLSKEPLLLYKTGDHAFQDTDGNITYVGRNDDQVKIRGHRIDLSEIEQVLIQHPRIDMAVVVVHKCAATNELSVAAYVAPTFIYISELREYLSKVLPRYMIPTYIKKLEVKDLPKTLNGKINRKKLEVDEGIHEQDKTNGHSHLNETQLMVAKYWCNVSKYDESFVYSLHRKSSFREMGGNSLQLVLLLRSIEDEMKVNLSFTDLGTADTIEEFAEVIRRRRDIKAKNEQNDVKTRSELREMIFHDSELDASIFPHPERRRSVQFTHYTTLVNKCIKKHPKNILLSGVTGFLGAFLLAEVLEQSNSHVCCMVRETTEARGTGRIIDNLQKYGLWKFEYTSRIAVVISDLSKKNLGIAPDVYKSLCNAIDVVFMNAAHMNFNTSYEDHKIPNVEGTKEFIKLASTGVQKYLFTTSSLSVFLFPKEQVLSATGRRKCSESEFFDDPLLIEGGYGRSKWASERLIMQALDFLPGGAIFRPARVSGRSTDGVGPKNDLFASTMIGMKQMGSYPDMDFPYDLTPVDFCAKAMIEVTLKICNTKCETSEKVYHLFNKNTIPFRDLFKEIGLRGISLDDWRKELKQIDSSNRALAPLTPFFMSGFWDKAPDWPVFDTSNLDNAISDGTKALLRPSGELLQTYKTFFGV
ncbi:linear gramicidin synthase subunit D-like [Mercenaria mercenaria]|uniref:linear gramicidin synthase subunit D-like n=1 Tax=Mercenaria mercenaria TaxID=6596 RepID=UPI00234EA7BE|nr:linear gramicidin synthase subunit D-like [Mercenaria mercenaria]XP_053394895.1 linear gramicidin synthase subunit D-like [Mercenaria mercenaria]XP_053394896.1 linear gramicidin synthase subunit D-like [Mercenaria mercenaria]